jgi:hypothetical protein
MRSRLSRIFNAALSLGCLVMLAGCGSTYRFKVDAVKNPDIAEENKSYRLVSANPEMDSEDLRFKEASAYVKTALSSKGMYEAPPGTEADMVIEVDFGMEEPRTEMRTISVPIYVSVRSPPRLVRVQVRDPKTGEMRTVEMMVEDPPQQQLAGFEERIITVTVYEKYIRITAREASGGEGDRPPREIWSVYVKNEDESDNLREYVPLMVSAAMDSVDENSSSAKEVVLNDSDERVTFVKKGM